MTSPPYSIALDYVSNDAHALKALGYDLKELREKFIGVRGKGEDRIELYNEDMKKSLKEMFRVLKPGKYLVMIIGNATYKSKVKPDYKDALLEKAFILIEKNNLNSEDATAYYNRACAYALIGDKKNWIININS
ncbi:MAG: DNA methyltransferase [candidate division WOR-3 bacterium]